MRAIALLKSIGGTNVTTAISIKSTGRKKRNKYARRVTLPSNENKKRVHCKV